MIGVPQGHYSRPMYPRRTGAMPRLTEVQLKNEQPGEKPRKIYDERGLFLLVNPDGSMYWRVRYSLDGKEKLTQVGVYRKKGTERVTMRLSEARRTAR